MTNEPNGNGFFTTKEILVRLEKKIDEMLADHESRLRSLERFRYAIPSLTALAAAAAIALTVYTTVHP